MNLERLQQAKDDAYNFLSYRERSRYEIETKLKNKGYQKNIIKKVTSDLKRLNYIDDYRFSKKWIKDRINLKPRGRHMLRLELKKKGIDNKIIDQVLNELVNDKIAIKMANKLARKWRKKNSDSDLIKLKRYLYNKGFDTHIINEICTNY